MRRPFSFVLATIAVLAGCNALIDIKDIHLDDRAVGPGGDGSNEAALGDAPLPSEGGDGGGGCNASNLPTDKKNCGRCGHDCLGGDCLEGKCQVVALAGSLAAPDALALDATNVYVANTGDGTVVRIPKTGGAVMGVVTGWQSLVGVAVSGTTLFWSSDGTLGDAGVSGNFGGVWKCTLPACTDKALISTVGNVRHLDAKNGYVYYAGDTEVRRVKIDGTGDMKIVAVNSPFAVAADATHVYYTSNENSVGRSVIAGGGVDESVGPLNAKTYGFISVDADRFFWAYTDVSSKGQAFGGLKSATATRVSYGNANQSSIAIASDGKNVYWANDGTATGIDSNGDGELLTCPVAGCGSADPVRLVDKLHYAGPIVIEGNAVYFLEFGGRSGANGRLLKIAAP